MRIGGRFARMTAEIELRVGIADLNLRRKRNRTLVNQRADAERKIDGRLAQDEFTDAGEGTRQGLCREGHVDRVEANRVAASRVTVRHHASLDRDSIDANGGAIACPRRAHGLAVQ